MTTRPSTPRNQKIAKEPTLVEKLNRHKAIIAAERDKLQETLAEFEGIIESCERADESLEEAVDALSEYL